MKEPKVVGLMPQKQTEEKREDGYTRSMYEWLGECGISDSTGVTWNTPNDFEEET